MRVPIPMYTSTPFMGGDGPLLSVTGVPSHGRVETCGRTPLRFVSGIRRDADGVDQPTVPSATSRSSISSGWSPSTRASQYGDSNSA